MKKDNIVLLLDETGSMNLVKQNTITSLNGYVASLARDGMPGSVTLIKFNSCKTKTVYKGVPLAEFVPLSEENYRPAYNTPLYDAVFRAIRDTERLKGKMLFVIITDGEENASHEVGKEDIVKLIKEKTAEGWVFVYLGANQDAWAVGTGLGIHAGNTQSYDTKHIHATMQSLSAQTNRYRHAIREGDEQYVADFFSPERPNDSH